MASSSTLHLDAPLHWLTAGPTNLRTALIALYGRPGPFVTVYLGNEDQLGQHRRTMAQRWAEMRRKLRAQGAAEDVLCAIDRRLSTGTGSSAPGLCVIAAADGTTLTQCDYLRPMTETGTIGPLPAITQLLEWHQRRIPTLVAVAGEDRVDLVGYSIDDLSRRYLLRNGPSEAAAILTKLAVGVDAQLIILIGQSELAERLAAGLLHRLPIQVRLVRDDASSGSDLVAATMRHIGVAAAGETLRHLREQRFLTTVEGAVEGAASTIEQLASGKAELLLVHERLNDGRSLHIGSDPQHISLTPSAIANVQVPLVDGLLWSAVLQGIGTRITPSLGPAGPADDVGAILPGIYSTRAL